MSMLLNDILVLSSTEASNLRLEITPIYLLQFCCDTVEQAAIVDDWKHSFEMLYGGDLNEVIRLDERLLKHVILNLVLNAAKYSPVGTLVTLVIEITKDDVLFQIEDCGIGIPAKDQEKVFESFYRGSNVGTISGTGLGLAITKRSVEAQGGEISFESEEGIGTTFRVRFPLVK
jgi:signal transduction histidine kinase